MARRERGLIELYEDPERADAAVFGRRWQSDRRGFLKGAGLGALAATLGAGIPYARFMPGGLIPAALADESHWVTLLATDGLTVLNDRPINAETPPHLLDDDITPNHLHFVRNNGVMPEVESAQNWRFTVEGTVYRPMTFSLNDLSQQFEVVHMALQLECGGNGRAGFTPAARGNQWTTGAIGNAVWTGVRLVDVLAAVGVKAEAVYTAHYSADTHLSGDPEKLPISRGMPLAKAIQPNTLLAFAMNGEPLPLLHGGPLRVVAPGWPGSVSQKWLQRIGMRDQVHDGPKMTGKSYRVPANPVAPGTDVPNEDMRIIEAMPVKSLITRPQTGLEAALGSPLAVRGHAWAGDRDVSAVDVSIDFGASWQRAELAPPPNAGSWQTWNTEVSFPKAGYYEVWARATDEAGLMQPMVVPGWNPRGYLNNSCHRIAVTVA
jgi:DMSO/TMAO reductase YedYZ molybdopterin-dependent catalytic subunit